MTTDNHTTTILGTEILAVIATVQRLSQTAYDQSVEAQHLESDAIVRDGLCHIHTKTHRWLNHALDALLEAGKFQDQALDARYRIEAEE